MLHIDPSENCCDVRSNVSDHGMWFYEYTIPSTRPTPPQVALQQSDYVAYNIWADKALRKPLDFRYICVHSNCPCLELFK